MKFCCEDQMVQKILQKNRAHEVCEKTYEDLSSQSVLVHVLVHSQTTLLSNKLTQFFCCKQRLCSSVSKWVHIAEHAERHFDFERSSYASHKESSSASVSPEAAPGESEKDQIPIGIGKSFTRLVRPLQHCADRTATPGRLQLVLARPYSGAGDRGKC